MDTKKYTLPFTVELDLLPSSVNTIDVRDLPNSTTKGVMVYYNQSFKIQSGNAATNTDNTKMLVIGGRTTGIHPLPSVLTPQKQLSDFFANIYQNYWISVIDLVQGTTYCVVLPPQLQESLSLQNQQSVQVAGANGELLYIVGGYGQLNSFGDQGTSPHVSVVQVDQLINLIVTAPANTDISKSITDLIAQTIDFRLLVTGGELVKLPPYNDSVFYLVFGQQFWGSYNNPAAKSSTDASTYTKCIKRFHIIYDQEKNTVQVPRDPNFYKEYGVLNTFDGAQYQFNRRDLNVLPVLIPPATPQVLGYHHGKPRNVFTVANASGTPSYGIMVYSGVFAPDGSNSPYFQPLLFNATDETVSVLGFVQLQNNYKCAAIPLSYTDVSGLETHFAALLGGISMANVDPASGTLMQYDSLFKMPLTNKSSVIVQHINAPLSRDISSTLQIQLDSGILPAISQPSGVPLTSFGAECCFLRITHASSPDRDLAPIDISGWPENEPQVIGFIYGGIDSTDPSYGYTDASSRVYRVTVTKQPGVSVPVGQIAPSPVALSLSTKGAPPAKDCAIPPSIVNVPPHAIIENVLDVANSCRRGAAPTEVRVHMDGTSYTDALTSIFGPTTIMANLKSAPQRNVSIVKEWLDMKKVVTVQSGADAKLAWLEPNKLYGVAEAVQEHPESSPVFRIFKLQSTPDAISEHTAQIPWRERVHIANTIAVTTAQFLDNFSQAYSNDNNDIYTTLDADQFVPYQQWNTLGQVSKCTRQNNTFLLTVQSLSSSGNPSGQPSLPVLIEIYTSTIFRVRFNAVDVGFYQSPNHSYAILPSNIPDSSIVGVEIEEDDLHFKLITSELIVQISKAAYKLVVYNTSGVVLSQDADIRNISYIEASVANFKIKPPGSYYYGFGEKAGLSNEKSGQNMSFFNTDQFKAECNDSLPMYISIPLMIEVNPTLQYSTGIFLDNPGPSYFNIDNRDVLPSNFYGQLYFGALYGDLDYWFIYAGSGQSVASVVKQYTNLTGKIQPPPLYALGFSQGGFNFSTKDALKFSADQYRACNFPADAFNIDIDIQNNYENFTVDPTAYSGCKKFFEDMQSDGWKICTNLTAAVKNQPSNSTDDHSKTNALAENILLRDVDTSVFTYVVDYGFTKVVCNWPDFTPIYGDNGQDVLNWWKSNYEYLLANAPFDFVWQDMTCPALGLLPYKTIPLDIVQEDFRRKTPHVYIHNAYGLSVCEATAKVMQEIRPNMRNFIIARGGYAGLQRAAAVWTGDSASNYHNYIRNIQMCLNLGMSGLPISGSDIGGFAASSIETSDGVLLKDAKILHEVPIDLLARWMIMGAFLPWYRNHYFGHGLTTCQKTTGQEAWQPIYADALPDMRRYCQMRYRLLQYLYDYAFASSISGEPIVRALYYDHGTDVNVYNASVCDTQFILGQDILVAPFLGYDQDQSQSRSVYLPTGSKWYPITTTNNIDAEPISTLEFNPLLPVMVGGSTINVKPMSGRWYVPFFVQEGAIIPVRPEMQWVDQMPAPLTLFVFPATTGSLHPYTIHLDDGLTQNYKLDSGKRHIAVSQQNSGESINISFDITGSYVPANVQEQNITLRILGQASRPSAASIDAQSSKLKPIDFSYDTGSQSALITLHDVFSIGTKFTVCVVVGSTMDANARAH